MANKEDIGYVYIFTNESFREGWVKIGKTKNIKKRLTQLDNTSCPLPFDVYATLKTNRYDDAEDFVHDFISHFNQSLRIRPNREYFKVDPEEALDILYKVKKLMNEPGAEIVVYDEKGKKHIKQLEKKHGCHEESLELAASEKEVKPLITNTTKDANVWLLPYNKKYFELDRCFEKYGEVYWRVTSSFSRVKKGDIGYLYSSKPEGRIRYKFEVLTNQLPYSPEMDRDDEFSKGSRNADDKEKKFVLVKMTVGTNNPALKLESLLQHGLKSAPMGATRLSQEKYDKVRGYIEENF